MRKYNWILVFLTVCLIFTGCSSSSGTVADLNIQKPMVLVNNQPITEADFQFQLMLNRLQLAARKDNEESRMSKEEIKKAEQEWKQQEQQAADRNAVLTQLIRLQAVSLLAKEKGYKATVAEINQEMEKMKKSCETASGKKLWQTDLTGSLQDSFETLGRSLAEKQVLAGRVQQDIVHLVEQANPGSADKEVQFLASKKYEELLESQVSTLHIQFTQSGQEQKQ